MEGYTRLLVMVVVVVNPMLRHLRLLGCPDPVTHFALLGDLFQLPQELMVEITTIGEGE